MVEQTVSSESPRKADFEDLVRFRVGVRRYVRFSDDAVRSAGLTPGQYQLLLALTALPNRGCATVPELAELLALCDQSVVQLADHAQRKGLVRRIADPGDSTVIRLLLTSEGEQLVAQLIGLHRDELQQVGADLHPPRFSHGPRSLPWNLCDRIVSDSPDAVIVADADGVIRLWNGGAERLFGYSASAALGGSLDLIIPEKLRARHWAGYRQVVSTGQTHYGHELLRVPGVRADGRRISLEFSISILRDETGAVSGFAAILRDVTERWEARQATESADR